MKRDSAATKNSPDQKSYAGVIFALAGSALFGFIPVFVVPLLKLGYSVETIAFYRFGLGALLLSPCLFRLKTRLPFHVILKIMGIAAFYFLDVIFFFHALKYIAGGIVATLEFLCPVITLIIMLIFFGEKYRWQTGLAIAFALTGVWLLSSSPDSASASALSLTGVLLSLLAALCNSLYYIGFKWIGEELPDALVTTFFVMLSCSALCLGNGLLCGQLQWITPGLPLIYALLLALLTAALSNLFLVIAIGRIGPLLVSILGIMEPVAAMLAGMIFLEEKITPAILAGLLCSLLAVLLAIRSETVKTEGQ